MATYDRTITGGGTVGHPGNLPRPYVITSPVYDAVDNTSLAGDDVVKLIDLPEAENLYKFYNMDTQNLLNQIR